MEHRAGGVDYRGGSVEHRGGGSVEHRDGGWECRPQ